MQDAKNAIYQKRFPQKLWYLLNLHTDAILWGGTGRTILFNYRILYRYLQCDHSVFKTTNISSFVRQLNLYGFRKVTSHLQDPLCNSSNPYMHEYVHDYFQFGRPELLNKIKRKPMSKIFKPKTLYGNGEQVFFTSPLQKARRALHIALRKAAQDLYIQNSPRQFCSMEFECEDREQEFSEDEHIMEPNWIISTNEDNNAIAVKEGLAKHLPEAANIQAATDIASKASNVEDSNNYGELGQDNLMSFNDDSCQQTNENDNFSTQFLNMPELGPEPTEDNSGVELLAEFNISQDIDQGIIRKVTHQNDCNSLNCVLPSVINDRNDYVSLTEKTNDVLDHYNDREWDQMLNDIIINKTSSQECGSDLKELYCQISRTIDLLNS